MNDADTVEIDDDIRQTAWFVTEASGFMGVQARQDRLISRVAERMRRRARPEHLISNSIFGLFRHAATAAILSRPRLCGQAFVRHLARLQHHALKASPEGEAN